MNATTPGRKPGEIEETFTRRHGCHPCHHTSIDERHLVATSVQGTGRTDHRGRNEDAAIPARHPSTVDPTYAAAYQLAFATSSDALAIFDTDRGLLAANDAMRAQEGVLALFGPAERSAYVRHPEGIELPTDLDDFAQRFPLGARVILDIAPEPVHVWLRAHSLETSEGTRVGTLVVSRRLRGASSRTTAGPGVSAQAIRALRTPLTTIVGHAELLADDTEQNDIATRTRAHVISRAAQKLSALVDDLSKRADRLEQRHTWSFDVLPLVRDVLVDLRETQTTPAIDIESEAESVDATTDPLALAQALTAITVNALVHSGTSGRVTIRVHAVDDRVHIDVMEHRSPTAPPPRSGASDPGLSGLLGAREGTVLGLDFAHATIRGAGGEIHLLSIEDGIPTTRLTLRRAVEDSVH